MKRASKIRGLTEEQVLKIDNLSDPEIRFLVSNYYWSQEGRKRADMQLRHLGDKDEPGGLLTFTANRMAENEEMIKKVMERVAINRPVGRWLMAQYGIGPVISAGLMAHLAIELPVQAKDNEGKPLFRDKKPVWLLDSAGEKIMSPVATAGHFYSFCGLNPERKWEKGEKRPYCAEARQLCYHAGECFKRTSGSDKAYYGRLYRARKEDLVKRNDAGAFAERAKTFFTKSTEVRKTLAEGKLPAGNLDSQAMNYAVKIFLSHLHGVMFWDCFKQAPPKPYAIAHLNHVHEIKIPNLEMFDGLAEAYYGKRAA